MVSPWPGFGEAMHSLSLTYGRNSPVRERKYICLYGGKNIDWIRKFSTAARAVAQAAKFPLELTYIGQSNPDEEQTGRKIAIIVLEKLSHAWEDLIMVWFFWERLESMWSSKSQLSCKIENDPIMQEIDTMLSFGPSDEGWAVFYRRSALGPRVKPYCSAYWILIHGKEMQLKWVLRMHSIIILMSSKNPYL
ncbi:hypothetical protein Patl1_33428 [Pistacia atlantica]|uniref:Uncharacterized protein n=1 Tax=Pistacia atlantica TaxID=434234 RepID=A0ACC0ZPH2_9ROSI|nr:hypothetical protein Patl1_33428 [Pistacia atlantica]